MISSHRSHFNDSFTETAYASFIDELNSFAGGPLPFRVAETPLFIPEKFKQLLKEAGNSIIRTLSDPKYRLLAKKQIPSQYLVPGEDMLPLWLTLDFAVCTDKNSEPVPMLIELQGFPSLFGYQNFLANTYRKYFKISDQLSHLENLTESEYIKHLNKVILNGIPEQHVVMMDIEPQKQNTFIDFVATSKILGIESVCISDVIVKGKNLYYKSNGNTIQIKRIYNRVIFDELIERQDLNFEFDFTKEYEVEWAGHPNWFFLASKFTLPYLDSKYVPESYFINDMSRIPDELDQFVLKPLYSFSGKGVDFDVSSDKLDQLQDKKGWILQKKVNYAPVFYNDGEPVMAEIRLMYSWEPGAKQPRLLTNLVRLTKGKMTGVKYNQGKRWVGSSVGFWEK